MAARARRSSRTIPWADSARATRRTRTATPGAIGDVVSRKIGENSPTWRGSLANELTYKRARVSFLLERQKGGLITNFSRYTYDAVGTSDDEVVAQSGVPTGTARVQLQRGARLRHLGRELLEAPRSNAQPRRSSARYAPVLERCSLRPGQCDGPQPVYVVEVSEGRLRPRSAAGRALTGCGNDVGALGVSTQSERLLHH